MALRKAAKTQVEKEYGFGTGLSGPTTRLINKDGSFKVRRTGTPFWEFHPYHFLITISWGKFGLIVLIFYLVVNSFFAGLYLLFGVEHLSGIPDAGFFSDFLYAFYLSVQTFTTVGYGTIAPMGHPANIIASLEAMSGLLGFALATGLLYGRFSKPSARIIFSHKALIAPYRDINSLQFRIVNRRSNQLIELEAQFVMSWLEERDGEMKRAFRELPLELNRINFFPLSWTLVHPITEDSPLAGKSHKDLQKADTEFFVLLKGYDDTFAQHVYTRSSYKYDELVWGARFLRMFFISESGETIVEVDKLHDHVPAKLNSTSY